MSIILIGSAAFANCITNPVLSASFPDPTFWRAPDGSWRATSTSLRIFRSKDFFHWENTGKCIFTREEIARIRKSWTHIWAPDAFRLGNEYLMYVAFVNSSTNSAIAVYSSRSPEGPFTDGRIITHGCQTGIADTIDPDVVRDPRTGELWLFFGSIGKMHRVKLAKNGKELAPDAHYEHVAGLSLNKKTDPSRLKVFEGAYLHRRNGWWYLFASRGFYKNHTYAVVVGRARTLAGPFRDREGRDMKEGFATTVLCSQEDDTFFGPGHNGEIVNIGGRDYMPFHCHLKTNADTTMRVLCIQEVHWDKDDWPSVRLPGGGNYDTIQPCNQNRR